MIPNEHVIEVEPCKRGDWTSVIRQMGDEAVHGGFGDVENQKLLESFFIFSIYCSRGERSEDELVDLQDKHGHEQRFGRLIGHCTNYPHWNPSLLRLHKENTVLKCVKS